MASPTGTQVKNDAENNPGDTASLNSETERRHTVFTCKEASVQLLFILLVTGLLSIPLFFILRAAYAPSNSTMSSALSAPTNTTAQERTISESLVLVKQNINCTTPEDLQPKQLIQEENRVVSDACGGIINISRTQKGYIVGTFRSLEHCAWIIKSDMKKVKIDYANESLGVLNGTVIGELDAEDEDLSCSKLESASNRIVRTPFVLYFTKTESAKINFVIQLTPMDDSGSHASQPLTYHVHRKMNGSLPLILTPIRSESFLGLIAVFQTQKPNGFGRHFTCSPTGRDQCCDFVAAYAMDDFKSGGSCKKISQLNSGDGKASYGGTMVALYWPYMTQPSSECRMTWSRNKEQLYHVSGWESMWRS